MYGDSRPGAFLYGDEEGTSSLHLFLNEALSLIEAALTPTSALMLVEFLASAEAFDSAPDRSLSDNIKVKDWLSTTSADSPWYN